MFSETQKKYIIYSIAIVALSLSLCLVVLAASGVKFFSYIGRGVNQNTVSFTGNGEVYAVPDTATFSYSVVETGKTPKEASDKAAQKNNKILDSIKSFGVDSKDIQTTGYNVYPKYKQVRTSCPPIEPTVYSSDNNVGSAKILPSIMPCYNTDQVINGYEINQTITVKVRDTNKAGDILAKVGDFGASNVSSLNFIIDNPEKLQTEARDKAIADAKAKADSLSKSLGVKLNKIINYYENGGGVYYNSMKSFDSGMGVSVAPSAVPTVEAGQNKITSNVTVVYEVD